MSLDSIHKRLSPDAIAIQLPIGAESEFVGIVDLITKKPTATKEKQGKML